MRYLVTLIAAFGVSACGGAASRGKAAAPGTASVAASTSQDASRDSALEFLINAAARDFHDHRPPEPAQFRQVRLGYVVASGGGRQYKLCGEFLPKQERGKAEWMPFATIKTSGYEQWLGPQAVAYCQGVTWDSAGDMSAQLWSRFESVR